MDQVSTKFHKNVSLLTKLFTPHDDFKKHFKEGMFDKPNTLGFIHVSYYLLNIYYKDNIKNKVQWPVICKQTENKFRNDVRECLIVIANENADVNFPPIFASHLLLARGTKFLLIMWKFSLVVLRTYLQENQTVISCTPKPGPCQEMTKKFLKNVTTQNNCIISRMRKERENAEEEAEEFLRKEKQNQKELKSKILNLKEDLKANIDNAPVNNQAKKQLTNIEDNDIINTWSDFVNNKFTSILDTDYKYSKELNEFLKPIGHIILNLTDNSQIMNGLNFDRVNIDPIYKLIPPELQIFPNNLYNKENLNLQNFFSVFNLLLEKFQINFHKYQPEEFVKCINQLQMSNEDLKSAIKYFQNIHEQIVSLTLSEIKRSEELNDLQRDVSNIAEFDKVLSMPSPSIQINSLQEGGQNIYQNLDQVKLNLKLTPVEGAYKSLFSRHPCNDKISFYPAKKKPLFVQRINFDEMISHDISSDKLYASQEHIHIPTKPKSTFKNMEKYSRIFSSRKLNDSKVNNSAMMMMSSTDNSVLPLITKKQCISLMDSNTLNQEFSQESLLLNPNLNSTMKISNKEREEEREKIPQKNNKRRSIGDLVERYKKIIEKRDQLPSKVTTRESLGEETVDFY